MKINKKETVRSETPKDKPLSELKKIYNDATKNTLPVTKKGSK